MKKDDGGVDVMYSKDDSIHKVGDINSHITDISNKFSRDNTCILALLLAQNFKVNLRLLGVDLLGP